jgi:hypothetical protein
VLKALCCCGGDIGAAPGVYQAFLHTTSAFTSEKSADSAKSLTDKYQGKE